MATFRLIHLGTNDLTVTHRFPELQAGANVIGFDRWASLVSELRSAAAETSTKSSLRRRYSQIANMIEIVFT